MGGRSVRRDDRRAQRKVNAIEGQLDRLDSMIDEQASLYEELNADRQDYLAYVAGQRAALEQARESASNSGGSASTTDQPTTGAATRRR